MRTGIDAWTGRPLTGWEHCVQCIRRCLFTRVGSRVRRRHLGSMVPLLQDENADPATLLKLYVAIADSLNDPLGGEPGFNLISIDLLRSGRDGRFVLLLDGQYFPRGHLGDYSVREDRSVTFNEEALT